MFIPIIIENSERSAEAANAHGTSVFQTSLDIVHDLIRRPFLPSDGEVSLGIIRLLDDPVVGLRHMFVDILSDLSSLIFVFKDLCLVLGRGAES